MPSKMVTSFRRSVSFPNPPFSQTSLSSSKSHNNNKTLHVRSASLPCGRSHPIISQLKDSISNLNSKLTLNTSSQPTSSAWLCQTLSQLKYIHETLDDLLRIPKTRESFRDCTLERSGIIQKLLEDFLRLVDVYGTFQTLALNLKQEYSSLQICVRRNDEAKLAMHAKNLSKAGKEIGKLVSSLPTLGKSASVEGRNYGAETMEVIHDVLKATLTVSVVLFRGLSRSLAFKRESVYFIGLGRKMRNAKVEGCICEFEEIYNLKSLRKMNGDHEAKMMLSKKMQDLEVCVVEIEGCGEKVFRSLISTRVSLLNVITQ